MVEGDLVVLSIENYRKLEHKQWSVRKTGNSQAEYDVW